MTVKGITGDELQRFSARNPRLRTLLAQWNATRFYGWQPRPDHPEDFDEQTAFVNSTARFSILLGGTGAGKTDAAGYKTAHYVLTTPPPRKHCPFWIIGESYELACGVCWNEKLSQFIPQGEIEAIDWYKRTRNWPFAVMLKNGWDLEFKSYKQGPERMQARSIGGYWFNEEVRFPIVEEVQGRCRDYDSPGWADFTPINVQDPKWPEIYEHWETGSSKAPKGWAFYHVNVLRNTALKEGWAEDYLSTISEDMRETRKTGVFASFRGAVYKEWRPKIHVIDPDSPERQAQFKWLDPNKLDYGIPHDWDHIRAIDFGYNNPFVCLWIAIDPDGRFYAYDEHYRAQALLAAHANAIKQRPWFEGTHPNYRCTFADHDSQDRAELNSYGIATTAAYKHVHQGLEDVRELLMVQGDGRPRLYVFSRCENLIREMRAYKWPEGTQVRNPMELPVPKDDHAADGLRYGCASWLRYQKSAKIEAPQTKSQKPWETKASRFLVGGGR